MKARSCLVTGLRGWPWLGRRYRAKYVTSFCVKVGQEGAGAQGRRLMRRTRREKNDGDGGGEGCKRRLLPRA